MGEIGCRPDAFQPSLDCHQSDSTQRRVRLGWSHRRCVPALVVRMSNKKNLPKRANFFVSSTGIYRHRPTRLMEIVC